MDSFNITISTNEQPVSLTLQPGEADAYKVVYHDMLVGVIVKSEDGSSWNELPIDQVSPGIYKMYEHDAAKNIHKVMLDEKTLAEVASEIERKQ